MPDDVSGIISAEHHRVQFETGNEQLGSPRNRCAVSEQSTISVRYEAYVAVRITLGADSTTSRAVYRFAMLNEIWSHILSPVPVRNVADAAATCTIGRTNLTVEDALDFYEMSALKV